MSSRTIDILTAIQNGQPFNAETASRSEAILKSIANKTAYIETPQSKYEELLLAIKNKHGYGNQLFDKNNYESLNCSFDADGKVMASVTEFIVIMECEPNTTYTYRKHRGDKYPRSVVRGATEKPKIGDTLEKLELTERSTAGDFVNSFTTGEDHIYIAIWYYCTGSEYTRDEMDDSLMVYKGETVLPYEPYAESKLPQSRLENILYAIANNEEIPQNNYSDIEKSFVATADKLKEG